MATRDAASRGYYSGNAVAIASRGYAEARGTVMRSAVVAFEATRATPLVQVDASTRARDIATAGLYGGVSTIAGAGGFRAPQFGLAADFALGFSACKTITVDHAMLFDLPTSNNLVSRSLECAFDAKKAQAMVAVLQFDARSAVVVDSRSQFEVLAALYALSTTAYEGNRLLLVPVTIPLECAGAWGATVFLHANGAVHFSAPPLRPGDTGVTLRQPSGRDTSGALYAYTKSTLQRRSHTLVFRADKTTLDALIEFHCSAVRGEKAPFTWYDQDNQQHTVNFVGKSIPWKRIGPDRYEMTVGLREDTPL